MSEKMILFWGSGSAPCWRPMIVLEEKGLQGYESKRISFDQKEHKGEDVLKLNPRGQVPAFKDGDKVINESIAICDYLEYAYPGQGTKLYPDDASQRAKVLQRVHEANSNLQKNVMEMMYFYNMFRDVLNKEGGEDVKGEFMKRKAAATAELKIWEEYLEQEGEGNFLCGKEFTMADVTFFPFVAFGVRLGLDEKKYPKILAYKKKVAERESIKATWPPHWKDSKPPASFVSFADL